MFVFMVEHFEDHHAPLLRKLPLQFHGHIYPYTVTTDIRGDDIFCYIEARTFPQFNKETLVNDNVYPLIPLGRRHP